MIDKQTIIVAGSIAGAVAVALSLLGGLFTVFSSDMQTLPAVIMAALPVLIFAAFVLAIDNRIRITQNEGDKQ